MAPRLLSVLDARRAETRRLERHRQGALRNMVLSASTLLRYMAQAQAYFSWLEQEEMSLPTDYFALDESLEEYLEYLWGVGSPRSYAANCLCGLQHLIPPIKRNIPGAWRLYGAWQSREEPARAWPFDQAEAEAIAQCAIDWDMLPLGFMLWTAYIVFLRPCEIVYRNFGDFE